jgi:protein gp37
MEGHKLTPVWPLPNVWLGTSIEDQQRADERVPLLLDTPAALRFLSCEPLLGPIDLHPRPSRDLCIRCGLGPQAPHPHPDGYRTRGLDWVLIGGESGLHARPFDLAWARSIVAQCRTAGAVPFVKQLGAHPVSVIKADTHKVVTGTAPIAPQPWRVMLHNRHGSDPTEWPEDLRVREFPVLI